MSKYKISQNNSGGHFIVNKDVSEYIIIEAENSEEATEKFKEILNRDEFENGLGDYCECCGDRWCEELSDYSNLITDEEIEKLKTLTKKDG